VGCYFTAEDVAALNSAKDDAHTKFEALRNKLVARTYNSNRGREYAVSGLIRRLDTMIRAIDYVYNILPPECAGMVCKTWKSPPEAGYPFDLTSEIWLRGQDLNL
jgi:hypothetical protein